MTTLFLGQIEPGTHLLWGLRLTAPSGSRIFEARACQAEAVDAVQDLNNIQPGLAQLAVREVVVGDWFGSVDGNCYGMRLTWGDRHVEHQPAPSRDYAESMVESYHGDAAATLASRWVAAGDWQLVGADVAF